MGFSPQKNIHPCYIVCNRGVFFTWSMLTYLFLLWVGADYAVAVAYAGVDAFNSRGDEGFSEVADVEVAQESSVVGVQGFQDFFE